MKTKRIIKPLTKLLTPLLISAGFTAAAHAQSVFLLTTDGKLATAPAGNLAAASTPVALTGIIAGETLVSIDVRPQNQRLYALGLNGINQTGTLYCISPETNVATPVGVAGSVVFTNGQVYNDPVNTEYDIDFNPSVDRLRVVSAAGHNFRVNPNSGGIVDGDTVNPGTQMDGGINGATTSVGGAAYTNNQPDTDGNLTNNFTTLYTVDAVTNSIYIQTPPNNGTQGSGLAITLGGNPLDFTKVRGFDIVPGVDVTLSNAAVAGGSALLVADVGGSTDCYSVNLVTGAATKLGGNASISIRNTAVRTTLGSSVALHNDGTDHAIGRFDVATPGTVSKLIITSGITAGEVLVGIDSRPATGQLYALGVNATANNGTLYLVDPQLATVTAVGTVGQIAFVDAGALSVDLPTGTEYGMDFNPTVDRIRVVTNTGLNFRINPNTGAPVDGDIGGLAGSVAGINTDAALNGANGSAPATAYTNNFGGATATTQYAINPIGGELYIQNPPNAGTLTLAGTFTSVDFDAAGGFDIPGGVSVSSSGTAAAGNGWAIFTASGNPSVVASVNLATGAINATGILDLTAPVGLAVFATAPNIGVFAGASELLGGDSVNFGTVAGQALLTRTFTVKNSGSHPLTYDAAISNGSGFTVTGTAVGTLNSGASADITVAYEPSAVTSSGTLLITSDDPDEQAFTVQLSGPGLLHLTDDSVGISGPETRFSPLANDGLSGAFAIIGVSDPLIGFDGRYVLIPSGYNTSFDYDVSDGITTGRATVSVTEATPIVGAKTYTGLLLDGNGENVGWATITVSGTTATVQLRAGTVLVKTKLTVPGSVYTNLGNVVIGAQTDGQFPIGIQAFGGIVSGALRPAHLTATAEKHHIALASTGTGLLGGGYAIATISTKGAVKVVGVGIDGLPFSAGTALSDNASFTLYSPVIKGPKPPAFLSGELFLADITATDVTGELAYNKLPQLATAKGTERNGVETILTANGCRFDGTALIAAGAGTLKLNGGNLAAKQNSPVTIAATGIPTVPATSALKTWTGVSIKKGLFKATVTVPTIVKPVKGGGIYLPKSNTAWGYFPGTTSGGRIELTMP